jgi:hypothetical protein
MAAKWEWVGRVANIVQLSGLVPKSWTDWISFLGSLGLTAAIGWAMSLKSQFDPAILWLFAALILCAIAWAVGRIKIALQSKPAPPSQNQSTGLTTSRTTWREAIDAFAVEANRWADILRSEQKDHKMVDDWVDRVVKEMGLWADTRGRVGEFASEIRGKSARDRLDAYLERLRKIKA